MPYNRSLSYIVASESNSPSEEFHDHSRMHDPCRPRVLMYIDDNNCANHASNADDNNWRQEYMSGESYNQGSPRPQLHVHEIQGSVQIAEPEEDPHNHRFTTVSGEAIPFGNNNHYHEVRFRTDFYEEHFHEAWGRTSGAIQVGDRHVHFLSGVTTVNDGHLHRYRVATLIDDPIGE
jgi:hypothetical protein